ncbi:copper resistance protein CopC [Brevibacillus massiliensis]|uniref:copper resistance protein CopC n=1 Tax=Brevibacillus massiliensis TaxID=1118054 RepID=UPI0002F7BDCB|nr:copper resistance protein CopC [Brevibacillus massiliensis]
MLVNAAAARRLFLCCCSLLLVFCLGYTPASAHAYLISSTPANGEVMENSPALLALSFSEPLEQGLYEVQLYDWNARLVELPSVGLTPGNASKVTALLPDLPQGTYTVRWNVLSADGHPVHGVFSFFVGQPSNGSVSPLPAERPASEALLPYLRFPVESLLLLGGGLSWLVWPIRRRGLPDLWHRCKKPRQFIWVLLLIGTIGECALSLASLPGANPLSLLSSGKWELLLQPPFIRMALIQLLLLLLAALPNMVSGWYPAVWLLLVCNLAIGGHVWGTEHVLPAIAARMLHLIGIAIWLSALACLAFVLACRKVTGDREQLDGFRPFFVRLAAVAAGFVTVSGAGMVMLQTDWAALLGSLQLWNLLLLLKIVLMLAMLLLALLQTVRWRSSSKRLSRSLLYGELTAGIAALLAGVLMSQTAYPLPAKGYSESLGSGHVQVQVDIPRLQVGKQTMQMRLADMPGQLPEQVVVHLEMADMDMGNIEIPATATGSGTYQAELLFSMTGYWRFTIDARYPDGTRQQWRDTVLVRFSR